MHPGDRHDTSGVVPDQDALSIRLLGEFDVSRNGRSVTARAWRFHNARRLVQILVLAPGHRIHREQVSDWFWPDSGSSSANNSFHQVLHHARRALASVWDGEQLLRLDHGILSLHRPMSLWIDVEVFENAAGKARQHRTPDHHRVALDLYTGDLLPEERYASWAGPRREALRSTYLALLLELGELYEAGGALAKAENIYNRLIVDDPRNENGHAGLMRLYARTGRRHQSLAQFRQIEEVSRRELDVEPSLAVLSLRDAIRQGSYAPRDTIEAVRPGAPNSDSPFVGRVHEIHALRAAVEQSFVGGGNVLMLTGEPGIGKSRTAREMAAYARSSGSTVLWGNCREQEDAPAFWLWIQIIRQAIDGMDSQTLAHLMDHGLLDIAPILPELRDRIADSPSPANVGAEQARFQLFDSITRFFKRLSLRRPLLVVLDDLHWADHSTLLLLSFLAREIGSSRIVMLGAYRETDTGADHPLIGALAELSRMSLLQRLPLGGLPEPDVRQWIEASLDQMLPDGTATLIHQRTAGNPFFISEVLRMIRDGDSRGAAVVENWATMVPSGVRDVIRNRVSRLSDVCGELLNCAAVIGREFGPNMLEVVSQCDRETILNAIDEALHARLIEQLDTGFRFSHALVQETTYLGLGSARRAELHRRAGEGLERLYPGELDQHLAELAYHFRRAAVGGDVGPAVTYGIRAGDQALAQVAYSEAINIYQRTLDVIESYQPAAVSDLLETLLKLGDVYNHVGQRDDARTTFRRAANLARELQLPEQFGQAALGYAGLGIFIGGPGYTLLLEEAMERLPDGDTVLRARIIARLAYELTAITSIERRRALIDEAEAIARRIGDPSTLIFVLIVKNWTLETPDNLDARLALAREVLTLVEESNEIVLAPTAHAMEFERGLATADMTVIDRHLETFETLANRSREPQRKWLALIFRASRAVIDGCFQDADELIEEAHEVARNVLLAPARARGTISLLVAIRREQGRLGELQDALATVAGNFGESPYWRAMQLYARSGPPASEDVSDDVEALVHEIESADRPAPESLLAAAVLSTTPHVSVQPALADTLNRILEPYSEHQLFDRHSRQWYGPVSYFAGRLATVLERWDAAEHYLRQAIVVNTRMGARPLLAHSQYELACSLQARGGRERDTRAETLLCAAHDLAVHVGMPVLMRNIQTARERRDSILA